MSTGAIVYLNGEYLPAGEAKVAVLDRGFIFGDGVYEVIPVYNGHLFRLEQHLQRLTNSLQGIRIDNPKSHQQWGTILKQLVARNEGADQSLYLHITRGVAPRDHAFPKHLEPTIFAMSSPLKAPPEELLAGVCAISVEDIRWRLCHIKSIALLPNILLRQQAIDEGCTEAIMLRDGEVTEGAATNIFIVSGGVVVTPIKSNLLLPGVTRDLVVDLCHSHQVPCEERRISEAELNGAEEIWLTSSTKEIVAVTQLNNRRVGTGTPGPIWAKLLGLFQDYKGLLRSGTVS